MMPLLLALGQGIRSPETCIARAVLPFFVWRRRRGAYWAQRYAVGLGLESIPKGIGPIPDIIEYTPGRAAFGLGCHHRCAVLARLAPAEETIWLWLVTDEASSLWLITDDNSSSDWLVPVDEISS